MARAASGRIRALTELEVFAAAHRRAGHTIVLCHGCFDVVHPGHLRYLQFARAQGDVLVVSITADDAVEKTDGTRPHVPQELRAESLAAIEIVDCVVIASWPTAEPVIRILKPDIYVKGREYEHSRHPGFLAERAAVEAEGGRVLFSSGEVVFSSTSLLDSLSSAHMIDTEARFGYWLQRNGIEPGSLVEAVVGRCRGTRIVVVGDAIVDRYTFCDAHAVAGEAPVLSVRPIEQRDFIGGASVIASHLRAFGAETHLITGSGEDGLSGWLESELAARDIRVTLVPLHHSVPMKQRFVVDSQKVLKVDHVTARPLDTAGESAVLDVLNDLRTTADAVVFSDFGCGIITLSLLSRAVPMLRSVVPLLTGDVSGQQRSLLGCRQFDLLTPNERELRGVLGDFEQSLPSLADNLMRRLQVGNLLVTMGARGAVLFRPREEQPEQWFMARLRSDHLPARTRHVIDPLGAGDACLAAATAGLAAGLSAPAASCLGMVAAAVQATRVGNPTLDASDLCRAIRHLPPWPSSDQRDETTSEPRASDLPPAAVPEAAVRL
jgi:rfaE bifunctional protein kinase chain/domain/rfaE bifunctional protein nucleotidyltransferase chain/domain